MSLGTSVPSSYLPNRPEAPAGNLAEVNIISPAYKFAEQLQQAVHKTRSTFLLVNNELLPVANLCLIERLQMTTKEFNGRMPYDHHVDIGYHYTRPANMARIQIDGLLSLPERQAANIRTNYNGSAHGEGVYVADSPYGFHGKHYGDVGLLVARLKGVTRYPSIARGFNNGSYDSTVVNPGQWNEFCVLEKSSQCLPLVQFDARALIDPKNPDSPGNKAVFSLQVQLQQLVDALFNHNVAVPIPVTNWKPCPINGAINARKRAAPAVTAATVTVARSAPKKRRLDQQGCGTILYQALETMPTPGESALQIIRCATYSILSEQCTVCLDALSHHGKIAHLIPCGHLFHKQCLHDCLQQGPHCPTCRTLVGDEPQGKMPSGHMKIAWTSSSCEGYESVGTIVLNYHIPKGIQKPYHQNPGQGHDSATRTAYLPDSDEGNQLLKRLKYAFLHGLTFTVGTSLTSGRPNSVTWSSIHHKTNLRGGASVHGYPDPDFFANCNLELDALFVPPADRLDVAGTSK